MLFSVTLKLSQGSVCVKTTHLCCFVRGFLAPLTTRPGARRAG